jgi:hypothetical protein
VDEVVRAPAPLDVLERERGIVLPASFRELWTLSDGTGAMDDDGFSFWPLDNITSDPSLGPWAGILVFADWQLQSRYFGLRFHADRAAGIVDEAGRAIEGSFDGFLERYLMEPKGLHTVAS